MIFRKPVTGATSKTPEPVIHDPNAYPVTRWQEIASPVWMTIDQTNVLNVKVAREDKDERHLCPLQLDVIERSLVLYSNPNDLVFSPFTGIGSEGWQSLRQGRRFLGTELKDKYYNQAVRNLVEAEQRGPASDLLAGVMQPPQIVHPTAVQTATYTDRPRHSEKSKAFLEDIFRVYEQHKMAISHEDSHGGFILDELHDTYVDWLKQASEASTL